MVKHIVFFKLTSFDDSGAKEKQLDEMERIFSILPEKLNYIAGYVTGRNISTADHAWDFVIDSVFENINDLKRYQASDEHQEAIKDAAHIGKIKAVVDYDF
jgi:hypothetical protein